MKVQVDVTNLSTTRRTPMPGRLSIRQLNVEPDNNGNYEVEVSGPRANVLGWLRRNGYERGDYDTIEL
jgi:hypothetical protein